MGYNSLVNYYQTNFELMQHHNYSLRELEEMIPWERLVYLDMLKAYVAAENEKHAMNLREMQAQGRIRR